MKKTLKIFDPIKFPIEMLFWPLNNATIDVTNSGRDVPKATTVTPITNSDTPK